MRYKVVKVGTMPGYINEFKIEIGTSIADVLILAELNTNGYEIRVNWVKVNIDTVVTEGTNTILLVLPIV